MLNPIPSAADVRAQLDALTFAQVRELASVSQVPFTTLWKIRSGETENPGIETLRKFMEHVSAVRAGA